MPIAGQKLTPAALAGASALVNVPPECPPDSEQLGRSTWTFLHTAAAYYPEKPTPQHRRSMLSLLTSLPILYPCSYCAEHLGGEMEKNPPDVSSREKLSQWLCNVHNEVNERLGKEKFDCSRVLERWKDGPADGSSAKVLQATSPTFDESRSILPISASVRNVAIALTSGKLVTIDEQKKLKVWDLHSLD
ncbi:11068_t:CDS:2, partial [Acaulospora colombiana]